ncbi:MAG: hypothetical protein ACMG51_04350 [Ginsengibacter sp.]
MFVIPEFRDSGMAFKISKRTGKFAAQLSYFGCILEADKNIEKSFANT